MCQDPTSALFGENAGGAITTVNYPTVHYLKFVGILRWYHWRLTVAWHVLHASTPQANQVGVVCRGDVIPPFSQPQVQFQKRAYLHQLVQRIVDRGRREVGHRLAHAREDLFGGGVWMILQQGLDDGPALGRHPPALGLELCAEMIYRGHAIICIISWLIAIKAYASLFVKQIERVPFS